MAVLDLLDADLAIGNTEQGAEVKTTPYLETVIFNIKTCLSELSDRLDLVEDRVTYLEGTFVVTAIDVTSIGNTTIVCTAELTVKLTVAPNDKDIVRVKQTSEEVIVDGNGRTIEGESEIVIRKRNTSIKTGLNFIYSAELDEWFII